MAMRNGSLLFQTIGYVKCNLSSAFPKHFSASKVPIIKEDIKKQKNPENSHQPPFSDAYISGMPKKRRLEHQQQQKQQPQNDGNAN